MKQPKRALKLDNNHSLDSQPTTKKALKVDSESPLIKDSISITQRGASFTPGLSELNALNPDANNYLPGNEIGDAQMYLNQPTSEVITNAIGGFGTQMAAGFVDSLGAWDLKGVYDVATGKYEEDYGNFLNELGKDIREVSDKNFQIYAPGDDLGSVEYWAKQGQSLGYSTGIIAEMLGEQALLSFLGPEANVAGVASKARLLKQVGQAGFGMFKGVQEGYMNALETQSNVYQKYVNLGYDELAAKQKANEAASLGFRAEVGPLAIINGLQFMSTFGRMGSTNVFKQNGNIATGFSDTFQELGEKLVGNRIKNKTAQQGVGYLTNALSEGIEEGIQTTAGQYAQQTVDAENNQEKFNHSYLNTELRDSMIGGALGGAMFGAGFKAYERLTNGSNAKKFDNQYTQFIDEAVNRTANSFNEAKKVESNYVDAVANYNQNKTPENKIKVEQASKDIQEAKYNSHLTNTVNALQYDYSKGDGSTTAFEAHVGQMEDILEAVNSSDVDTLKRFGLITEDNKEKFKDSFNTIKETFPQNIEDSKNIKGKLENNLSHVTSDFEAAFNITKKEYLNEKSIEDKNKAQGELDFLYNQDTQFKQLSPDAQRRFKLEAELTSLNQMEKLNEVNTERKEEIKTELEETKRFDSKDKLIVDTINKDKYVNGNVNVNSYNQAIEDNNKELANLRNRDYIKKEIKERTTKKIDRARSEREVLEAVQEAESKGISREDVETQAAGKVEQLQAQNVINQDEVKPAVKPKPIEESSQDMDELDQDLFASILSQQTQAPTEMGQEFFSRHVVTPLNESHPKYDQIKTAVNAIAKRLDTKLNRTATLQDFIEEKIAQTTYDEIEDKYNGLVEAWKLTGRDISNAESIYNNTFADNFLLSEIDSILSPEQATEKIHEVVKEQAQPTEFDLNGQVVKTDYSEDRRTTVPSNKAAFNFLEIQRVGDTEFVVVNTELKKDSTIDNFYALVPDFVQEDNVLEVRIEDNDSIPITAYRNDGSVVKTTWGEYKSLHNITDTNSDIYVNKVPMVAYKDDTPVFYIHDMAWWNNNNVSDANGETYKKEAIEQGRANTSAIRRNIVEGNNRITVTNRSFGNLDSLVEHTDKKLKTINEATGDSQIVMFKNGAFRKNNTSEPIEIDILNDITKLDSLGNSKYSDGQIYDVRHVATTKTGGKQYIALPVVTPSSVAIDNLEAEELNQIAFNNIKFAVLANALLVNDSNELLRVGIEAQYKIGLAHAKNIQQAILRSTGLDITSNLQNYVSLFTNIYNDASNNVSIDTIAKTDSKNRKGNDVYPIGKTYIKGFNAGANSKGSITVFSKDRNYTTEEKPRAIQFGNKVDANKENAYLNALNTLFNDNNGILKQVQAHVNTKFLNNNQTGNSNFITVNATGQVSEMQGNYEHYIKGVLKTNVLSHKIQDTEGKDLWVTDVQPKINFELTSEVNLEEKPVIKSVQEKIKEAAQSVIEEDNKLDQVATVKALEVLPEHLKDIFLNQANTDVDLNDEFDSRRSTTPEQSRELNNVNSKQISTLNEEEQKVLLNSLQHKIIASLDFITEDVSLQDVKDKIVSSVNDYVQPQIKNYKEIVANLSKVEGLDSEVEKFQILVDKLQGIVDEQEKLTSFSADSKGQLTRNFEALFGGNLQDLIDTEEDAQEDNFSNSFLEKDLKLSFSTALKLSLFGYEKLNKNNQKSYNFANLENYESADTVELALKEITTNLDSDWDAFLNRLDIVYKEKGLPIYQQLKNKLKYSPEHIKNELLYKTISSKLTLYKVIYSYNDSDKTYSLKVIDENSSKEEIKLPMQFKDNFIYKSPFGEVTADGERKLNKTYAKAFTEKVDKLLEKYKNNFEVTNENLKVLRGLLEEMGIEVDNNVIKAFAIQDNPFKNTGIISTANRYMKNFHNKAGDVIISTRTDENDFIAKISDGVKKLVNLQIELNGTYVSKSIRIDGKTMQGTIEKTMVYETVRELIPNEVDGELVTSDLFNVLSNAPYSQGSYILDLLKSNDKFRKAFSVDFSSPQASKIHGKDVFGDRDFDKISTSDNIITTLGLFSARMGNVQIDDTSFGSTIVQGLNFRMGQMTFPALADKGRMLYLRTALLDLKDKNVNIINGKIGLDQPLSNFLVENLFNNELRRILMSYKNEDTNIVGFDKAAKLFLGIPAFNEIKIDGVNIHTLLNSNVGDTSVKYYEQDINILTNKFKNAARDILIKVIQTELSNKVSTDGKSGEWVEAGLFDIKEDEGLRIKHIDSKFVADKRTDNDLKTIHVIAADFVINNLLNQSNIYKLFLGDLAYFSKDKMIKRINGQIDFAKMSENNNYVELSKAISVVIDKRAAMLIAPGKKLANSDVKGQNEYIQVQINDVRSVSSVMKDLIIAQYGELSKREEELFNLLDENQKQLDEAYSNLEETKNLLEQRGRYIDELTKTNKELDKYFDIEGTDAQEYTTWKTHIDMLLRQGRLTREETDDLVSAYTKMSEGRFNDVTKEEVDTIMQPVKPVATGTIPVYNKAGELISNRTIYIKSSSFPLIPQLTKGLQLDEVRIKLEKLEAKTNKMVRMSYQTANKIGAVNTRLTTQDLYNRSFEDLYSVDAEGNTSGLLSDSVTVLQTKNFKIQQETPSKTEKFVKKNKDNYITMGSQFWKVILGNGINHNGKYVFPNLFSEDLLRLVGITPSNGMVTGQDLDKIDFYVYKEYSGIQKEALYSDLDMDPNVPFNSLSLEEKNNTIKKLTELLRKEIIERGHPEYLQEVIDLVEGPHGLLETEMPLFLDASSNKFEALLQAIISTRLISHKLPGNGHISASSEGFKKVDSLESLSQEDKHGIVWFDGSHQGELKSTSLRNGKIIESEVLIRPHYRISTRDKDGTVVTKLVDLTSNDYSEPIYNNAGLITGRRLIEDMIDPELISQFSFRIPTSSHQSGVIIKVVGFLPPQVGDLLIVPKEHTTQLGEDYDIDKRYVYKSNYTIDNYTGKISKLQYDAFTEELQAEEFLKQFIGDDLEFDSEMSKRNKVKIKMLENAMIDIYKSVYQSPDASIQQKIFKPLSVQEAKDTANLMNDKIGKVSNPYFTPFSDTYQRALIKLGADGKGGIGVHSNAVTLEAQFQRLADADKVTIMKYNGEFYIPAIERIGDFESTGVLGKNLKTIDGTRDITDVHGENQNSSTDNINEQIMGKRNENTYTMGVFALMTHRGFDLTETMNVNGKSERLQLTSLFMNQPILRKYVELRQKYDSMTAQYTREVEEKIVRELFQEYHNSPESAIYTSLNNLIGIEEYEKLSKEMTGANLWDSLNGNETHTNLQVAVLQKFLRFKGEADNLREYQQLINLSTSKLGVSYFEVLQRISTLNKVASQGDFENIDKLIGEYEYNDIDAPERGEELVSEGYTLVGRYYWKPTTKEGIMLINSLKAANDIMKLSFPYEDRFINNMIRDVFRVKGEDINKKSASNLKWKYEIMSEFKDFMNTLQSVGIYEGDVNSERYRLFFDKPGNKSLAFFLADLKRTKHPIMKNSLLADLSPKVKTNGEPSLIEHITDYNTNFDRINKYDAFKELLLDNETVLGTWNGEEVTPRMLAQDLASYAYLANNENGAIGFRNFIHLAYFKTLGMTENFRNELNKVKEDNDYSDNLTNKFVRQYFQHNPNRAVILSHSSVAADSIFIPNNITPEVNKALQKIKDTGKGSLNSILSKLVIFEVDGIDAPYVSVRNTSIKGSDNQFNLYEFRDGFYHRIPTLGTFGYNEYNGDSLDQRGLLDIGKVETTIAANSYVDISSNTAYTIPQATSMFKLENGVTSLLQQIYDSPATSPEYKKLIEDIQNYIKPDVKIDLAAPRSGAYGSYNVDNNVISIHPDIYRLALADSYNDFGEANNLVKEVVLEEVLHSITVKEFKKYVATENKETGEFTLRENAPLFATKLKALYDIARDEIPFDSEDSSTYYSKNVYEFMAGMFVASDYRNLLEERSEGFLQKFAEMLKKLLGSIYTATTGKTLTYKDEVFNNVFDLLKANKTEQQGITLTGINPMKEIIEEDTTEKFNTLFNSGLFSSSSEGYDSRNRLPEIKKCK